MFRKRFLVVLGAAALLAGLTAPAGAAPSAPAPSASEQSVTLRLGPYTIPPAANGEHGALPNQVEFGIEKPCDNCYVTGFEPNLVYADGSNANVNTGPMLHHAVIFDSTEDDIVCGGPRRVFATGNERVESVFPEGYGFRIGPRDRWTMLADLMNHAHEEKTAYIEFTFTYENAFGSDIRPVEPLWLDVGGCAESAYDVPPGGPSEKSATWRSTVSGQLVHMRGHLHHGGVAVQTVNTSTGETLCRSVAEVGGSPEFIDHHGHAEISDMPRCGGSLGRIGYGDELKITAEYEASEEGFPGAMGIMTGWVTTR